MSPDPSTISQVIADPGAVGIRPFEAAVLHAEGYDIPDILLSRMYLKDTQTKELLSIIFEKSGALIDDAIREFVEF